MRLTIGPDSQYSLAVRHSGPGTIIIYEPMSWAQVLDKAMDLILLAEHQEAEES